MKLKLLLLSAFISLAGTAHAQRIVVLTPDTADIVAALGALDEIVGRDQTVQNPALKNKPSIGIHRRLTVEPIVAAKPDIAIGSWMAQPADILPTCKKQALKPLMLRPMTASPPIRKVSATSASLSAKARRRTNWPVSGRRI